MPKRKKTTYFDGKFPPERKRWLTCGGLLFLHYVQPDGSHKNGEGSIAGWGESHQLTLVNRRTSSRFTADLTEMTELELDEFQKFVNLVIDRARPVTKLRDTKAREAFDAGDDGYTRLYRSVPEYVDRERSSGEHDPSDAG